MAASRLSSRSKAQAVLIAALADTGQEGAVSHRTKSCHNYRWQDVAGNTRQYLAGWACFWSPGHTDRNPPCCLHLIYKQQLTVPQARTCVQTGTMLRLSSSSPLWTGKQRIVPEAQWCSTTNLVLAAPRITIPHAPLEVTQLIKGHHTQPAAHSTQLS